MSPRQPHPPFRTRVKAAEIEAIKVKFRSVSWLYASKQEVGEGARILRKEAGNVQEAAKRDDG